MMMEYSMKLGDVKQEEREENDLGTVGGVLTEEGRGILLEESVAHITNFHFLSARSAFDYATAAGFTENRSAVSTVKLEIQGEITESSRDRQSSSPFFWLQ
jgi:hypothetical protein